MKFGDEDFRKEKATFLKAIECYETCMQNMDENHLFIQKYV